MKALFVERDGKISERDVPVTERGDAHPVVQSGQQWGTMRTYRAQLWRNGRDRSTETFIYVEDGAPQEAIDKAGKRALSGDL